ncbi:MAG: GGDEF domain-containing protein [Gammaproteobacteria bacterium]|nr:GGDEF domain-containing protein [Gammaproteobacteria bacterium]
MDLITTRDWTIIFFGLIFMITCAHMLVVYVLSGSSIPTPGLGLYTVYFMAVLLGWIAYTLKQVADIPMTVDVPSVAAILNAFIFFLAASERAGSSAGRIVLGVLCTAASLCVFFLPAQQMFMVQTLAATVFFTCAGIACLRRGLLKGNSGDYISTCAALLMLIGMPIALYQLAGAGDYQGAQAIAFGTHSIAFVLVATGFLASVAIEYQQQLSSLATQDPLTRLLNRRGLEQALQLSLVQAARQQLPSAAIMIDIDQFGEINRSFGPELGDRVIRRVAEVLQQLSRGGDVVARTGGDEFLLVLPQTNAEGARMLAERIRELVAERPMVIANNRVPVTLSMGVASIVGAEGLDKLSQDADRAMALAKRAGGNRVASVENRPVHLTTQAAQARPPQAGAATHDA